MSRATFPVLIVVLALGMSACGGDDDDGQATTPAEQAESIEAPTEIVGGSTVLKLDRDLLRALDAAQVEVEPVGAAEDVPGGIALPITTGELDIDTPSGVIEHAGGLEFSAFGTSARAARTSVAGARTTTRLPCARAATPARRSRRNGSTTCPSALRTIVATSSPDSPNRTKNCSAIVTRLRSCGIAPA